MMVVERRRRDTDHVGLAPIAEHPARLQVLEELATGIAPGLDPQGKLRATLVNVGGSFKVNETVEAYGRIDNLFDRDYREVFGFPVIRFYSAIGFRIDQEDWDAVARVGLLALGLAVAIAGLVVSAGFRLIAMSLRSLAEVRAERELAAAAQKIWLEFRTKEDTPDKGEMDGASWEAERDSVPVDGDM